MKKKKSNYPRNHVLRHADEQMAVWELAASIDEHKSVSAFIRHAADKEAFSILQSQRNS